ncbi:MAG: N-acetylmuramoyl-L-alanine amidase-like domain-containing protein [Bacteroidota bacterium]
MRRIQKQRRRYIFWVAAFMVTASLGAQITCSSKDSLLFQSKITALERIPEKADGNTIIPIAKSFLGTPYIEKTLEVGNKETLVINLRGMDCTTFVENVLAFALVLKNGDKALGSFVKTLETIRYRNGKLNGYPSRLHYFTEWIRDNESKGLVQDITSRLGGKTVEKTIDFMSKHRELYPYLADESNFAQIREIESKIAEETLCVLPQRQIKDQEPNLKNGDIIALATSIKGLDVTHTGIAVRVNDRIHLLHASISGSVAITEQPLTDYLEKIKNNIGIIVARPTLFSSQAPQNTP